MADKITYLVNLDVCSANRSLEELTDLIGYPGDGSSLNKGDIGPRDCVRAHTIWRLNSQLPEDFTTMLHEHVSGIFRRISPERISELKSAIPDIDIVLSIGVCYSSYTCTICLPYSIIKLCSQAGVDLECVTYPTSPDDPGEETGAAKGEEKKL